jgi:SAM-dependent methyltransferase
MSSYQDALNSLRHRYRFLLHAVDYFDGYVDISGFLTPPSGQRRLLVDGATLESFSYPLKRPKIAALFQLPEFAESGFTGRLRLASVPNSSGWADYIVIRPDLPENLLTTTIVNTWLIPRNRNAFVVPPDSHITRVTGRETASTYLFGGATHAYRLVRALELLAKRDASSFSKVVDWGCGAGRLTQHFARIWPKLVTGADVDKTNVEWSKRNLRNIRVEQIPWQPPTQFSSASFDLLFSFSVFSHIKTSMQDAWLHEISRILQPGGIAVITTLGTVSTASRGADAKFHETLERNGFVEWGNYGQLDDVRPNEDAYLNIAMSKKYASSLFGRHFEVLGVVEGAGPQDAWVVRKT